MSYVSKVNFDGTTDYSSELSEFINIDVKNSVIIGENAAQDILVSASTSDKFNVIIGNNTG